jgi:hypothetical protein
MDMAGCSSLLPPMWHLRCLKLPRVLCIMDMQVWERCPCCTVGAGQPAPAVVAEVSAFVQVGVVAEGADSSSPCCCCHCKRRCSQPRSNQRQRRQPAAAAIATTLLSATQQLTSEKA